MILMDPRGENWTVIMNSHTFFLIIFPIFLFHSNIICVLVLVGIWGEIRGSQCSLKAALQVYKLHAILALAYNWRTANWRLKGGSDAIVLDHFCFKCCHKDVRELFQ